MSHHLAFVAPPYLGHLNPMLALAGALQARGHRVTLFGLADSAALAESRGIPFAALGARSHPAGTLARMAGHMAAPGGLGLLRVMRDMSGLTAMLCRELPKACRAAQVDGIVTDQLEAASGLVAAHLGLPYVTVANALPIRRDPLVPPPFLGWRYDASPGGLARNRGGYRVADLLMTPVSRAVRREARALGLCRPSLESCLSPLADITQLVPELDFPRLHQPDIVHPCGPLRAREADDGIEALRGDGRPLVFASLGTLQGARAGLFRRVAEACRRLDLHLVIAHGGRLPDNAAASLPGRPVVRAFVPQRALLRHAVLAVTNGGLNTVLDAAAAGVPVLVIPIAFEQAAIGARVEHAGVGTVLPRRRLRQHRLEAAMEALMVDEGPRRRAAALADVLAQAGGVAQAASIVEAVVTTGRPVVRDTVARAAMPAGFA